MRYRIDHDLAYQVSDRSVDPMAQMGASVSVSNGEGAAVWQDGPAGKIMPHFKIKGVTSRLVYTDGKTPPTAAVLARRAPSADPVADYAGYRALFPLLAWAGLGDRSISPTCEPHSSRNGGQGAHAIRGTAPHNTSDECVRTRMWAVTCIKGRLGAQPQGLACPTWERPANIVRPGFFDLRYCSGAA